MASFYKQLSDIAALQSEERHKNLSKLHQKVLQTYLGRLAAISEEEAHQVTDDGRTLAQVVGHIAAWERWTIQATLEMFGRTTRPNIMSLKGYIGFDGKERDFKDDDDFNAYHAKLQAKEPWTRLRDLAAHTATALFPLYNRVELMPVQRLDETDPYTWELPNGEKLNVTVGWFLWMITLAHESVEHASQLGLPSEEAW